MAAAVREFVSGQLADGATIHLIPVRRESECALDRSVSESSFDRAIAILTRDGTQERVYVHKVAMSHVAKISFDSVGRPRCTKTEYHGSVLLQEEGLLLLATFEAKLKPESFGCEEEFQHAATVHIKEFVYDGCTIVASRHDNSDGSVTREIHGVVDSLDAYDAATKALTTLL